MRKVMLGVGMVAMLSTGVALGVRAQGPPPGFGGMGPGPGGPMTGMFEFGGLRGGFGDKLVVGKPIQATFTITHTETIPGNSISNTTTGTFARAADGSTYRDVKLSAMGPWAASGKTQEFIYIRNVTKGTQYLVNVTKGTYQAFPLEEPGPKHNGPKDRPNGGSSSNETVTDNPSANYTDPVTNTVYPVDDRKTTRTIPAGAIGNTNAMEISSERWYSDALSLLLENTHTDPRFGTTTYQLSGIGTSPAASLFAPDPSFTEVQGKGFGPGSHRGAGAPPPPPPPPGD